MMRNIFSLWIMSRSLDRVMMLKVFGINELKDNVLVIVVEVNKELKAWYTKPYVEESKW
uniref:Uncharacterized protein n=1 Tax=Rhizophora mucronata TaxID=61149 RepID=A0A2P2NFS4_RHIMU